MEPQETGMQVCDSDGGELPDGVDQPREPPPGPARDTPLFPAGYEDRQVGEGVTRTRGCQEGRNTRTRCHVAP